MDRHGHGRRHPTHQLPAERLSAQAAGAYHMFPKVDRDAMAKAALDAMNGPSYTFQANPSTTVLEMETGKDLDDKIKAAQAGESPNPNNNSSSPETTTELSEGLGEQAGAFPTPGRNFSSPPPEEEETELPAERLSAKAAGANWMFPGNSDRAEYEDSMINSINAARRGNNVAYEAAPVTTVMELGVDRAMEARINGATSAAMKVAKDAGDVVAGAGHKLF